MERTLTNRQLEIMNAAPRRTGRVLVVLLFLGLMASRVGWSADFQPGTAKVQAILGRAQFSRASGPFAPLGPGMVLHPGDVVQTATSSAVDLYLVDGPGA